ncbi:MAG: PIN domain-containing protein [Burkholderiales bacterium]|nr:PIN domain-containing protein [Burkholderiales bacterium]
MHELPAPAATPGVVLDTNAVLDWLVFADRRIAPLAAAIEAGSLAWLAAPRMRAELADVLLRPAMARRVRSGEPVLTAFDRLARGCDPPPRASAGLTCSDVDDQVFLDLALAERARWLVTRDKALLALHRRARLHGLTIAVPEAWRDG